MSASKGNLSPAMGEYLHVMNSDGWGWGGCKGMHSAALQTLLPNHLLPKYADITSFKEISSWEAWVDHREGSWGDFSSFAFRNFKKRAFQAKADILNEMKRLWLFTASVGSCLQGLLSCNPEVSCILMLNEWPWSVLLLYSKAWAVGWRSNPQGGK